MGNKIDKNINVESNISPKQISGNYKNKKLKGEIYTGNYNTIKGYATQINGNYNDVFAEFETLDGKYNKIFSEKPGTITGSCNQVMNYSKKQQKTFPDINKTYNLDNLRNLTENIIQNINTTTNPPQFDENSIIKEAKAIIIEIKDTGTTFNDNPLVELILEITPPDENQSFKSKCSHLIQRLEIPMYQYGSELLFKYDLNDKNKIEILGYNKSNTQQIVIENLQNTNKTLLEKLNKLEKEMDIFKANH